MLYIRILLVSLPLLQLVADDTLAQNSPLQKKRVVGMSTRNGVRAMNGKLARYYSSSRGVIAVRPAPENPPPLEGRAQLAYPENFDDDSTAPVDSEAQEEMGSENEE